MYNFESSFPSAEDTSDSSNVSRLTFFPRVLDDDIGDLEDSEREGVFSVLTNSLEHTGKKGGSDDLVFDRLGVGENDSEISRILSVEEFEVLVVGALLIEFSDELEGNKEKGCRIEGRLTRIRGRTSIHPASAHNRRTVSLSLFGGKGLATVLV